MMALAFCILLAAFLFCLVFAVKAERGWARAIELAEYWRDECYKADKELGRR